MARITHKLRALIPGEQVNVCTDKVATIFETKYVRTIDVISWNILVAIDSILLNEKR